MPSGMKSEDTAEFINAFFPMLRSEDGSEQDVSAEQPANALLPIDTTPSSKDTVRIVVLPAKAESAMLRTGLPLISLGMTTFARLFCSSPVIVTSPPESAVWNGEGGVCLVVVVVVVGFGVVVV